ncbi:MAG TPA: hypothetical protein VGG77_04225 [Roseiarcus sp.]|jgi:hypothetical protein
MMIFNRRFAFNNLLLAIGLKDRDSPVKSEGCDGFRDASLGSRLRRPRLARPQNRRADVNERINPNADHAIEFKRILK